MEVTEVTESREEEDTEALLPCPVYKTAQRNEMVTTVILPIAKEGRSRTEWETRGVAVVLEV